MNSDNDHRFKYGSIRCISFCIVLTLLYLFVLHSSILSQRNILNNILINTSNIILSIQHSRTYSYTYTEPSFALNSSAALNARKHMGVQSQSTGGYQSIQSNEE